jgi:hypothetical protein
LPVGFDRFVLGGQVCDFPPKLNLRSGLGHSIDFRNGCHNLIFEKKFKKFIKKNNTLKLYRGALNNKPPYPPLSPFAPGFTGIYTLNNKPPSTKIIP